MIFLAIGGVTGIAIASAGIDQIVHKTYCVIAHFHYVLSVGALFSIVADPCCWIGKTPDANVEKSQTSPPAFHIYMELPRIT